jgi:hypothetical protein
MYRPNGMESRLYRKVKTFRSDLLLLLPRARFRSFLLVAPAGHLWRAKVGEEWKQMRLAR